MTGQVAWLNGSDGREASAARVLLYPGCGSLFDLLQSPGGAAATAPSPVLLLHGEDDPANPRAECGGLSAALGKRAPVRRISYRGAGYAWDLPRVGGNDFSWLPWPGGRGTILVRSWPALADLTEAQAAGFLAVVLSRGPGPPE